MNAAAGPSNEPHPPPGPFRRHRVALVLAVAALLIPSAVYFYAHDGGGGDRISTLDLQWASPKASEACTYDEAAGQMTLHLRLDAQTTGPMDVIAKGTVTRQDDHGDDEPEEYTGKTKVTVDGSHRQNIDVTVDVPADAHANGYDHCMLSLGYNRGEPWD